MTSTSPLVPRLAAVCDLSVFAARDGAGRHSALFDLGAPPLGLLHTALERG